MTNTHTAEDLRSKSQDELKGLLLEQRKAQMNMRFQRSSGQLEKTHEIRAVRRDIARIKTLMKADGKAPAAAKAKPAPKAKPAATAKPAKTKKKAA